MGFISRAFTEHGRTAEYLAAAQVRRSWPSLRLSTG